MTKGKERLQVELPVEVIEGMDERISRVPDSTYTSIGEQAAHAAISKWESVEVEYYDSTGVRHIKPANKPFPPRPAGRKQKRGRPPKKQTRLRHSVDTIRFFLTATTYDRFLNLAWYTAKFPGYLLEDHIREILGMPKAPLKHPDL